jgi:class 3 adenylate cyclase
VPESTAIHIHEDILEQRLAALEKIHDWSPRSIAKLEAFIRNADNYDLFRVNPMQYAKTKGMEEVEAIDMFIHAADVGLFEMEWHMNCAYCPQVVRSYRELSRVHSHYVCQFCQAVNDVSLDDYIQVTFTISEHVRPNIYHHPEQLPVEVYYLHYHFAKGIIYPAGLTGEAIISSISKVFADIEGHSTRTFELDLPPGRFEVLDLSHNLLLIVEIFPAPETSDTVQTTTIQLIDGQFKVLTQETKPDTRVIGPATFEFKQTMALPAGKHRIEIENKMDERGRFWLLEYPPNFVPWVMEYEPFLSGKRVLTSHTFRDLYRQEIVDSAEGLAIRDITFLFTDLKGSTALYEEIGDSKAYFLVRQHFDMLARVIAKHNGALVKTIGDAVMAAFSFPVDGVAAAIEMIEEIQTLNSKISNPLILKIGLHRGHSMAVGLNERIDYFGQNVNIASRIQGLANANEICISNEVNNVIEVMELIKAHHVHSEMASVKGVTEKLAVHRLTVN